MTSDVRLPEPRPVLWPLRARDTATVVRETDRQRAVVRIDHAQLRGVTAKMLHWWYGNVPGTMTYAGTTYPRYLVWHPLDHISYEVVRGGGPEGSAPVRTGSTLHIREALHRDLTQVIDIEVTVEELGPNRAVIVKRILGTNVVRLENDFDDQADGAAYRTTLTVGDTTPLARAALNRVAHGRAFPEARIEPWITHHIEEIGNLERFLPELFAAETGEAQA